MMRMTNEQVIKQFLGNATGESHNGNLVSTSQRLINYSTTLAQWVCINPDAPFSEQRFKLFINDTRYSVTTSKIQSKLRYHARQYESVKDVPMGTYDLTKYALINA